VAECIQEVPKKPSQQAHRSGQCKLQRRIDCRDPPYTQIKIQWHITDTVPSSHESNNAQLGIPRIFHRKRSFYTMKRIIHVLSSESSLPPGRQEQLQGIGGVWVCRFRVLEDV
jgi:hypothetical protein